MYMQLTATSKMTLPEKAVLLFILLILGTGYVLFYTDMNLFLQYSIEDGLVEWLTVGGLLLGSLTLFRRAVRIGSRKGIFFLLTPVILGLGLFLAAGEEISWGQRLLGIQSSEFFQANNSQGETNFHNLIVGGVNINRLVFSTLLIAFLSIYLVFFPILYHNTKWMKRFVSFWGIPLPKPYQIISFLMIFVLSELLGHDKKAEFLENGTAFMLFLISAYPQNKEDFQR